MALPYPKGQRLSSPPCPQRIPTPPRPLDRCTTVPARPTGVKVESRRADRQTLTPVGRAHHSASRGRGGVQEAVRRWLSLQRFALQTTDERTSDPTTDH